MSLSEIIEKSRLPSRRSLRWVTDGEIQQVRQIAREIGKRHKLVIHVRKGTGSMRGTVLVTGDARNPSKDTAPRIELLDRLIGAGFESSMYPLDPDLNLRAYRQLSTEWGHSKITLALMKIEER